MDSYAVLNNMAVKNEVHHLVEGDEGNLILVFQNEVRKIGRAPLQCFKCGGPHFARKCHMAKDGECNPLCPDCSKGHAYMHCPLREETKTKGANMISIVSEETCVY